MSFGDFTISQLIYFIYFPAFFVYVPTTQVLYKILTASDQKKRLGHDHIIVAANLDPTYSSTRYSNALPVHIGCYSIMTYACTVEPVRIIYLP